MVFAGYPSLVYRVSRLEDEVESSRDRRHSQSTPRRRGAGATRALVAEARPAVGVLQEQRITQFEGELNHEQP